MNTFENKVVLVTGASSGIGRATTLLFARSGASVVLADTNDDLGARTAAEADPSGRRAIFVKCDVSSPDQVAALFQAILDKFGRLDCAFNNAGIEGVPADTAACSEGNWDRVMAVNLKGTWLCMKQEIEIMRRQGGGAIVNCASIAGLVGFAGAPAYVASKHGMVGLTKTSALECAKAGIRVNAVCPGVIATPMIDRFTQGNAEAAAQMAAAEPIGRLGRPEEIADAVLWLCSDGASFVTGQAIAIDGGWVAQ